MSQATLNTHQANKECVLKCKTAKQFFIFPSEDIFRNIWMYKLGLENYDRSFRVCDRHFSNALFCASGKKLVDLAVPDKNLPETNVPKKPIYDQLIKKITPKPATKMKTGTNVTKPKENSVANLSDSVPTKGWLNDSSTLLMDYQLRIQGKHVCDVVELPECVVVYTVAIPKNSSGKNVSPPSSIKCNVNPPPTLHSLENVLENDSEVIYQPIENRELDKQNYSQPIEQEDITPEVDYVYYMTEDAIPRRDREIQVDMPIGNPKRETAIQCNIELDNDIDQMAQTDSQVRPQSLTMQTEMHECQVCGDIMENYDSLVRHAIGHENATSLCSRCGDVFPNRLQLQTHERDFHLHSNLHMQKALRCPKLNCKKAFYSRKRLNNHIEEHIRYVEHKCNRCLRLFPSSLRLLSHQKKFKNCWRLTYSKDSKMYSRGSDSNRNRFANKIS